MNQYCKDHLMENVAQIYASSYLLAEMGAPAFDSTWAVRPTKNQIELELKARRMILGVSDDIAKIDGLTGENLVALGKNGVKSLDDLADLATDELLEIVGVKNLNAETAGKIIMAARAHWFAHAD